MCSHARTFLDSSICWWNINQWAQWRTVKLIPSISVPLPSDRNFVVSPTPTSSPNTPHCCSLNTLNLFKWMGGLVFFVATPDVVWMRLNGRTALCRCSPEISLSKWYDSYLVPSLLWNQWRSSWKFKLCKLTWGQSWPDVFSFLKVRVKQKWICVMSL